MTQSLPNNVWNDDVALARAIAARDPIAVRTLTTRNNQRLFRAAWSIVGDKSEAEDVVQSAYLRGLQAIETFAGRSSLNTWFTRIVINEALGRLRSAERRRTHFDANSVTDIAEYRDRLMQGSMDHGADDALARKQVRAALERAITKLPVKFRTVFVMREIEGMAIDEIAHVLDLVPGTVKTRLSRARQRLQKILAPELSDVLNGAFPFAGPDCDAMTNKVIQLGCGNR